MDFSSFRERMEKQSDAYRIEFTHQLKIAKDAQTECQKSIEDLQQRQTMIGKQLKDETAEFTEFTKKCRSLDSRISRLEMIERRLHPPKKN